MIVVFPKEGKWSMNGRPCSACYGPSIKLRKPRANDRSNLLVPKEAHDLGCNLLRAEPRSILPLHQESQVTRPRAKLFHLYHQGSDLEGPLERQIRQAERHTLRSTPKVLSSSYVSPISDSDSSSCSPAESGKSSALGRASRNS
jgi:hypothetical protein